MNELEIALKVYGLRDGCRTVKEVNQMFGIDAEKWPSMLKIWSNGLVSKTEKAVRIAQAHAIWMKRNFNALGIPA